MERTSVAASAVTLISGTGLAQVVALLALPLLTRLYTPQDFGLFAVYAAILSLGTAVVCLRYELAIVLPKRNGTAFLVYRLCQFATLLVCVAVVLLLLLAGEMLAATFYQDGENTLWIWLIPAGLLAGGLHKASTFWATRRKEYRRLAAAKIGQSLPQTLVQIVLGFTPLGAIGLIVGEILGRIGGVVALRWSSQKQISTKAKSTTRKLIAIAAAYKHFPLVSSWSVLINQLGVVAPAIFIAAVFDAEVAGWYAMAQRVLAVPMDLIGQSIMSLYLGEISALKRERPSEMKALFLKYLGYMFLAGSLPVVVILAIGDWLFVNVLGAEWQETGRYAKVLVFAFWFRFTMSPLSQTLNVIERQDLQLWWDIARLVLVAIGFAMVILFDLKPIMALAIYSGVVVVAQLANAIITYDQLNRINQC